MCQRPPVTSLVCQIVHLLTCNMSASQLFNKRSVAFSRNYQLMYDVALTQIVDLQLQTLKSLEMAAVVGGLVDAEAMTALRDLTHGLGCETAQKRSSQWKARGQLSANFSWIYRLSFQA